MQPIFTIHAGEYLVGTYIEENFKNYNIWIPAKDTGIDLLVTNSKNNKAISLQVKYSKDYVVTNLKPELLHKFKVRGWWTLRRDKLKKSIADLWVFVMQSFSIGTIECVVIDPSKLLNILEKLHGHKERYQTYMWVTNKGKCWESRGLAKSDSVLVANNSNRSGLQA